MQYQKHEGFWSREVLKFLLRKVSECYFLNLSFHNLSFCYHSTFLVLSNFSSLSLSQPADLDAWVSNNTFTFLVRLFLSVYVYFSIQMSCFHRALKLGCKCAAAIISTQQTFGRYSARKLHIICAAGRGDFTCKRTYTHILQVSDSCCWKGGRSVRTCRCALQRCVCLLSQNQIMLEFDKCYFCQ